MTSAFSWQNSISLCPASFCIPRPNLPVTPGVSWLSTFAFQSPVMERTSFLGVSSYFLLNLSSHFIYFTEVYLILGFPCGSAGKESARNVGDVGSILGLGRSSGKGKGYPFQYSSLENSMDCIGHGVAKSWTWLSDFHFQIFVGTQCNLSDMQSEITWNISLGSHAYRGPIRLERQTGGPWACINCIRT